MNTENLNLKDILEWYVIAGVDEILGDEPFAFSKTPENKPQSAFKSTADSVLKAVNEDSESRLATTELAQTTISACKNARELCENAKNLDELKAVVENFAGCALKLTATKTVFGSGNPNAKIMLIGEAPGADEDRMGLPFVGRSGHLLDKILSSAGMPREECYIANVLPWRPPGNRTPTTAEVAVCLPFLKKQIDLINPQIIVLMGGSAANALLDNEDPISKMRGKWLEYKTSGGNTIAAMATFHPAYLLRNAGQKAKIWIDFLRLKKKII